MRAFLKNISSQLKQFSKTLDKKTILIDQPWAIIDEEFDMQKLIFKSDGELIMSKNGKVNIGSWEYLAAANSLLIDRGKDKILCKQEFIDEAVMILKLDGTDNRFFALANENFIPDLNIERYLTDIRQEKLNIVGEELVTGERLELISSHADNKKVLIDGNVPEDGSYIMKDSNKSARVKDGQLLYVAQLVKYMTTDRMSFYIDQRNPNYFNNGDYVYKDPDRNTPLEDGTYKLGWMSKITVKNGKIFY